MGLRGGCAAIGLVLAACVPAFGESAREVRKVTLERADDGATVLIELSRPATPHVDVVRGEQGELRRIHVDLPAGTAIVPGAWTAPGAAVAPVGAIRVGLVDGDHPRVVIEVEGARDYRLERGVASTTVALSIVAARPPAAASPPEATGVPSGGVATEKTARADLRRPGKRVQARRKIVIDPGHGGEDPGAEGFAVEKETTLDIAQRLAILLRVRLGAEVVLTRDQDATLTLKERTALANAEDADLFVSVHANANPTGRLRGVETYYLDNSTDHGTLRLAKMENGLDLLRPAGGDPGLRYILSDLVQVGKLDESARLARSIQRGLVGQLRRRYSGVVDLGVKRGPFYVLVGAYMPCVLVETAFVSHPVEGRRLARAAYRQEVAFGLYAGIAGYLRDGAGRRTL